MKPTKKSSSGAKKSANTVAKAISKNSSKSASVKNVENIQKTGKPFPKTSANQKDAAPKVKFQKISEERRKLIEEVVKELVSEDALPIVYYLIGRTKVSEFVIAQDLDLEIHKARNLLYKLFEQNILSFIRKKDKIKGWYICYWDFNERSLLFLNEKINVARLSKLRERLEKESSSTFYMCKTACTRMDFERAMEFNFKCPECGELMDEQNNVRTIEFLQERIKELGKETNAR
ncbi:MAG: hypothetical protein WC916_06165 [Candidatus Woesearchaeota archaeon]